MKAQQLPGYKPLCYIKKTLYLYKKGFIYGLVENQPRKVVRVYPNTTKEFLRVLVRLFRTQIRCTN